MRQTSANEPELRPLFPQAPSFEGFDGGLRPAKIRQIVKEMLLSPQMMRRRLCEGVEFFRFLRTHEV
jgi:hypothetical protein